MKNLSSLLTQSAQMDLTRFIWQDVPWRVVKVEKNKEIKDPYNVGETIRNLNSPIIKKTIAKKIQSENPKTTKNVNQKIANLVISPEKNVQGVYKWPENKPVVSVQPISRKGPHLAVDDPSKPKIPEKKGIITAESIKGSKLNPANWGVEDYSNEKDFGSAFAEAKKVGKKEFMWTDPQTKEIKRYSTDRYDELVKKAEQESPEFFNKMKEKLSPYKYDKLLYEHIKGGSPKVFLKKKKWNPIILAFRERSKTKDKIPMGYYNPITNNIILNENNLNDYTEELKHAQQNITLSKVFNTLSDYALGEDPYTDPKSFEYIHNDRTLNYKTTYGTPDTVIERVSQGDKIMSKIYLKNFLEDGIKPYDVSHVQQALINLGYKIKKDGIYGKETKEAFLDWRSKQEN